MNSLPTPLASLEAGGAALLQLATDLSLVSRPDVELVRLLRRARCPGSNVELELILWSSPIVNMRSTRALTLRTDALLALRSRLAEDRAGLAACWQAALPWIQQRAPLNQCEDRLVYLSLLQEQDRDEEFDDVARAAKSLDQEIEARLLSVVSAMREHEGRRDALAAWTARVMPLLPERVRAGEWARLLVTVAATRVPTAKTLLNAAPEPDHARLANRLAAKQAERPVWVRRVASATGQGFGQLELSPTRLPDSLAWSVPQDPPTVVVDDDRAIRLAATGTTIIVLDRDEPVLETCDGRRWLAARPKLDDAKRAALGIFGNDSRSYGRRIAYLVDEGHAISVSPPGGPETLRLGARIMIDFVRGGIVGARVAALEADGSIVLLKLDTPLGAPFTPVSAQPNASWYALSPFPNQEPMLGTVNEDGNSLTLSREPSRSEIWLGAPFYCHGLIAGHITKITGTIAHFCPAKVVRQWLRQLHSHDPVVELVEPPWRTSLFKHRPSRSGRAVLGRVGFQADGAVPSVFAELELSWEPAIFTQLALGEQDLDLFIRMGGQVHAARAEAFDPEMGLAALVAPRLRGGEPLARGPVPDPEAFLLSEPVDLQLPGGRSLAAELGSDLSFKSAKDAGEKQLTRQPSLLRVDLKLDQEESSEESVTADSMTGGIEAAERAERPPRCAPVLLDGKVVGLLDLNLNGDEVSFKAHPLNFERLRPTSRSLSLLAAERPFPRRWQWSQHNKAGILGADARTPGLRGINIELQSEIPNPGSNVLLLLPGNSPEVVLRGPGVTGLELRPLGHLPRLEPAGQGEPWRVFAPQIEGRSESWAMRRALRYAVELSRVLDGPPSEQSSSAMRTAVRFEGGLDEMDVGEIADMVAFEWGPACDVIEWFAERHLLELLVADGQVWSTMQSRKDGVLGKLAYSFELTELNHERGHFGWFSDFGGRSLQLKTTPTGSFLEVSASSGAPVTGWVSFYTAVSAPPIRVRARDGVARLPCASRGVLGAIVEREGLELELFLP